MTITTPTIETSRTTVLTPKGETVLLVYRMLHALAELGADDSKDVLELLHLELAELPA